MRKTILLLLLCVWLASVKEIRAQTGSSSPFVSGDWICVDNATGLTLKDYIGDATDLYIPSEIEGKPVTRLGNDLFMGNMRLKHVFIPGTVTVIGTNAFNSCTALESVELSFSITKVDTGTFRNCINLKSINLPMTVRSIGSFAFANCIQLTEIYLKNVTSIGESAFEKCESLSNVFVGTKNLSSVQAFAFRNTPWLDNQQDEFVFIGKKVLLKWNGSGPEVTVPWGTVMLSGTFAENDTIVKVTLPDTVRNIGQYAFRNAVNLKEVNIPQYVTAIGANAFEGCRSLTKLELPNLLSSIGASAFLKCERLEQINIPPRIKTIGSQTFADCPSLRELMIPETVTKVDKNAFLRSDHIMLRVVNGSAAASFAEELALNWHYAFQEEGDFQYTSEADGIRIVKYTGNLNEVTVPVKIAGKPVTVIGTAAFQNNGCVRRIILPVSLKTIESWAFSYMGALESVQIPASLKELGSNAFAGTASLQQVRLPRRLMNIGTMPFDSDNQTMICAREDSAAARVLAEMGYEIHPWDNCADEEITIRSEWVGQCAPSQSTVIPGTAEVLRIPYGLKTLTANLVRIAGPDLILFIPDDVEEIDPEIMDGRTLIIAASAGSYAEAFAAEHGIRFIARSY